MQTEYSVTLFIVAVTLVVYMYLAILPAFVSTAAAAAAAADSSGDAHDSRYISYALW